MRPKPITILCAVLFVLAGIDSVSSIGAFMHFPLSIALWKLTITMLGLASAVGLWEMHKWGVYLFLGAFFLSFGGLYYFPEAGPAEPSVFLLLVPVIYLAVVLPYWKRLKS